MSYTIRIGLENGEDIQWGPIGTITEASQKAMNAIETIKSGEADFPFKAVDISLIRDAESVLWALTF